MFTFGCHDAKLTRLRDYIPLLWVTRAYYWKTETNLVPLLHFIYDSLPGWILTKVESVSQDVQPVLSTRQCHVDSIGRLKVFVTG